MKTLSDHQWHRIPADDVLNLLNTNPARGLNSAEIQRRQEQFGPNAVPAQRGSGALLRFLLQFHQPLIYILLAASLVT